MLVEGRRYTLVGPGHVLELPGSPQAGPQQHWQLNDNDSLRGATDVVHFNGIHLCSQSQVAGLDSPINSLTTTKLHLFGLLLG